MNNNSKYRGVSTGKTFCAFLIISGQMIRLIAYFFFVFRVEGHPATEF